MDPSPSGGPATERMVPTPVRFPITKRKRRTGYTRLIARLDSQEIAREEVHPAAASVGRLGGAVAGSGDDQQVEILVGLHERVGDLHRARGIDVSVEFADDEHELALQLRSMRHVG